jgi:hypothetical protein
MNGGIFRRTAALFSMHLPHFLCCERAQRESRIHTLGSKLTFASPAQKHR